MSGLIANTSCYQGRNNLVTRLVMFCIANWWILNCYWCNLFIKWLTRAVQARRSELCNIFCHNQEFKKVEDASRYWDRTLSRSFSSHMSRPVSNFPLAHWPNATKVNTIKMEPHSLKTKQNKTTTKLPIIWMCSHFCVISIRRNLKGRYFSPPIDSEHFLYFYFILNY